MNKTIVRRIIKADAMKNMQGHWGRALLLTGISVIISMLIMSFLPLRVPLAEELISVGDDYIAMLELFIPDNITSKTIASVVVTFVLYLFIMCPLSTGMCRFYLKVAHGGRATLKDVFSAFMDIRTVFESIWLKIIILFMAAFWSFFVLLIPMLLLGVSVLADSLLLFYLAIVLIVAASLFITLWTSRYRIAEYIFADRGRGAFSAVRDGLRLIRGRNAELLALRASYFGWDIAVAVIPALSTALNFIYNTLSGTVYARYVFHFTGQMKAGEPNVSPEV